MSFLHHLFLPHETNNHRAKILHPSFFALLIGLFVLFQLGVSQLTLRLPSILGYASQIPVQEVIQLTNQRRQSRGLPPLKIDAQLSTAAAQKAADMFAKNYWAHISPSGTQPWFFVTQSGYSYRYAGENLAKDFSDASSIVQAWMDSPTHRDNLLSRNYQDIGVAVVDGNLNGHETTLVIQMFGTRLSASPTLGETSAFSPPVVHASTKSVPITTPFHLTKTVSLGILFLLVFVLVLDIILVYRRSLVRWTSRSFAHLAFIVVLLVAVAIVAQGKIL